MAEPLLCFWEQLKCAWEFLQSLPLGRSSRVGDALRRGVGEQLMGKTASGYSDIKQRTKATRTQPPQDGILHRRFWWVGLKHGRDSAQNDTTACCPPSPKQSSRQLHPAGEALQRLLLRTTLQCVRFNLTPQPLRAYCVCIYWAAMEQGAQSVNESVDWEAVVRVASVSLASCAQDSHQTASDIMSSSTSTYLCVRGTPPRSRNAAGCPPQERYQI